MQRVGPCPSLEAPVHAWDMVDRCARTKEDTRPEAELGKEVALPYGDGRAH